jgi:CBS domain-containing protein/Flp pilus assembly pilin Flp
MHKHYRKSQRRGTATIEYALFLALIAGGIVLAADTVSYAMRSSLEQTSMAMGGDFNARHLPVEEMEPEVDLVASLIAPDGNSEVQAYQFASVAGSLFCGAFVWYGLYCKRGRSTANRAQELTEQLNEEPAELSHDDLFAKRQQILRILSTDIAALLESRLEVRHLMSRHLLTVRPEATRPELAALMEEHNLRHLLVCDSAGQLQGIISDRDLTSRRGKQAVHLMTTDLMAVEAHAQVNPAITLLINKKISCLPVVKDGVPVGVLTSTDLMMALQCSMQLLQKVASENHPLTQSTLAKTISTHTNAGVEESP